MNGKDKTIVCKDCGKSFNFSADEQSFYAEKGYTEPGRCKDCRNARKNDTNSSFDRKPSGGGSSFGKSPRGGSSFGGRSTEREMFPATCAACGKKTQVPFKPKDGRPVYCSDCFSNQR